MVLVILVFFVILVLVQVLVRPVLSKSFVAHLQLVFPPGKSRREIWGFEISSFLGNLCRDPEYFFPFEGF